MAHKVLMTQTIRENRDERRANLVSMSGDWGEIKTRRGHLALLEWTQPSNVTTITRPQTDRRLRFRLEEACIAVLMLGCALAAIISLLRLG